MSRNIVLIGFMGSGKTTVGEILAREIDANFIDTDDLVVRNEGLDIPKIFETKGEQYFRKSETAALSQAMTKMKSIISTGGGIVTIGANKDILNKGIVIYLKASPDQIYQNVKYDRSRPLLKGDNVYQKICTMLEDREVLYEEVAHYTIEVDGKTPTEIATLILRGIQ